jgi:hypothetical protein
LNTDPDALERFEPSAEDELLRRVHVEIHAGVPQQIVACGVIGGLVPLAALGVVLSGQRKRNHTDSAGEWR